MTPFLLLILALQLAQTDANAAPALSPAKPAQVSAIAPTSSSVSPSTSAELAAVLKQLGDEQFEIREAAQSKLAAMSDAQITAGFSQIAAAYRDTNDLEIRMRLRRFADRCFDRLVLPHYDQLHQPGFLGVTPSRAKLEDGTSAIVVTSVIPDSPAAKAGLQTGDLITAVDDQPLSDTDPVGAFIKYIQQRHADMRVQFTLQRGEQSLTLAAQLVALPNQYRDTRLVEFRKEQIELLRDNWWNMGFLKGELHPDLPPPAAAPPANTDQRRIMIDD